MDQRHSASREWVVLTMGDRPDELERAVRSLREIDTDSAVVIVGNGCDLDSLAVPDGVRTVSLPENLGIPGGRDVAIRDAGVDVVGFLDDDAAVLAIDEQIWQRFCDEPDLAVVALRLVDENNETSPRHIPRPGRRGAMMAGDVSTFPGGACVIRRSAYLKVGGYWADLWYGHEEIDLSWRLIDAGYRVSYAPTCTLFHPRTDIGRHTQGWRLTGRNRVRIARRNLPWPVALTHTVIWLGAGLIRAPALDCRRAYLTGWLAGWRERISRKPISWGTVWRLTRLGRPPLI